MNKKNALYVQSGGVTAVINASACGVVHTINNKYCDHIDKIYAGAYGITGVLDDNLIQIDNSIDLNKLLHTPSGYFGSCRHKLGNIKDNCEEYHKLIACFKKYNIGYFFCNGGGDSQDTAYKISQLSRDLGYDLTCIGVPKTIDNDLPVTDNSPGFGSVAKYIAISTLESGLDIASMCQSSTKVFIMEVMGRHAGWIAASSGLAGYTSEQPPHIILLPEIPFNPTSFLAAVDTSVKNIGYCVIVVSEGVKNKNAQFLASQNSRDSFGHQQLGGVAPFLASMVKKSLGYKYHWSVLDYLQRSAGHIASQVDLNQAYSVGEAAVNLAMAGKNAVMPIIVRESNHPYKWSISDVPLSKVANQEKKLPLEFINKEGLHITQKCRDYMLPLIQGEAYPQYTNGLPDYLRRDILHI